MIYFIQDLENKRIKIGESDDPTVRIKQILTGSSSKHGCVILAVIPGNKKREAEIHEKFKQYHSSREWFEASEELGSYISHLTHSNFNICQVCGSLSLSKPDLKDIKQHSLIHKMMRNGVLPYRMREILKQIGWSVLYNTDKSVEISDELKPDDAKRLIAFSWWARAKQNGINEKSFDDFMLDQFEYLDARFDNTGDLKKSVKETI